MTSTFHRLCDNEKCIICLKKITIHEEGGRLTVPTKKISKLSEKTLKTFRLKWSKDKATDYVHFNCWEKLLSQRGSLSSPEVRVLDEVEEYIERFCTYETLKEQVDDVVKLVLPTERIVYFTGAGVSASSGIPTYRGADGIDTLSSLATAPAQPTKAIDLTTPKKGKSTDDDEEEEEEDEEEDDVDYRKLQPTFAHLALVKLFELNKLRYVITQNCDNLHQKAGIESLYISDLHGNVFVEYCEKCFTEYERDYCVDLYSTNCYNESWYKKCSYCGLNHYTGRHCEKGRCNGKLKDTIVNFKDNLHDFICGGYRKAKIKCKSADICFCLGSSLSVYPAADLPMYSKQRIIINLQSTELDNEENTYRIWATTDSFFELFIPTLEVALENQKNHSSKKKKNSSTMEKKRKREDKEEVVELLDDEVADDDDDYLENSENEQEVEDAKKNKNKKRKINPKDQNNKTKKSGVIVVDDDDEAEFL